MKLFKSKYIKKEAVLFSVCSIVILAVTLFYIQEKRVPYILGDEVGYWTSAAYFSGRDWSGTAAINGYFSFGYGLLLQLFFHLGSSVRMYQAAMILNALFLLGSFGLAFYAGKTLFSRLKPEVLVLLAFAACVYPSYLGYVQTNMAESLLMFLCWLIFCLLLSLEQRDTLIKSSALGIAVGFSYMVHMRMLAMIVACAAYLLILLYYRKIDRKHSILLLGIILGLVVITHILKNNIIGQVYQDGELSGSNDYSGQMGKIKYIFSRSGMKDLFNSVFGKVFYLGAATYTVFFWGAGRVLKKLKTCFKSRLCDDASRIYIFPALLLVCTLGVSSVFMVWGSRVDVLIYGRYNEQILGIFLLIGTYELLYHFSAKTGALFLTMHLAGGLWIAGLIDRKGISDINSFNIMGLFRYFCDGTWEVMKENYMAVTVVCVACLTALLFFTVYYTKHRKWVGACVLTAFFLYAYFGTYIAMANGRYAVQNFRYEDLCTEIEKEQAAVYCVYSQEKDTTMEGLWSGRIQFLNPDADIRAVDVKTLEDGTLEGALLFVKASSRILPELFDQYQYIGRSDDFEMFRRIAKE